IELDGRYAPIPADTRAMLRQKTLLGETYVELTPGNRNGPTLPEGATLPKAQVAQAVQLDEIFRTFNARTRGAFKVWMQGAAAARELSPTLVAAGNSAPDLQAFFKGLRGTINASGTGFPALRRLLHDDLTPLLARLDPYLANLNPIVEVLRMYKHEITAFVAN